jgi:AmmeMemoRadiSam system protein A
MVEMAGLLSDKQGQALLKLARKTLVEKLQNKTSPPMHDEPAFSENAATFVTLKIGGKLRGCIGNLEPVGELWEGIRDNAINAAFHDHRFSPLSSDELPDVRLDISILSQPKPLEYKNTEDLLAKLRPGIDGVILREGGRSATFLPQVWQQLRSPEQFLDHLCLKAGLPQETWRQKRIEILIYQVQSFSEERE